MGFPKKTELEEALEKLENSEGSISLRNDASPLERFRFDLCQKFIRFKIEHHLKQKDLASVLGVDEAKVSKILRYRIEEFSTDRLIDLYSRLDPSIRLRVG